MKQLFTIKRAAKRLQVSEQFLRKLQQLGRLRIVRLGRAVRIPERELTRLTQTGEGGRRGRSVCP